MSSESYDTGTPIVIAGSYGDRLNEAQWRRDKGQLDEALAIAQRVLDRILRLPERRRAPGSELHAYQIRAAALLADVHHKLGNVTAAEELWQQLVVWDEEDEVYWRREIGSRQVERGDVEQGLEYLRALTEAFPDDVNSWLTLISVAANVGQYSLAKAYLDEAMPLIIEIDDDGDLADALMIGSLIAMETANWREAVDLWYEALDVDPALDKMAERLLRKLLLAEQYDLAHELLDDKFLPAPVTQHYQAWIAQRQGDRLRARYLWRQVAERDGDDEENTLVVVRALALCWLGRPWEAAEALLRIASEERSLRDSIAATVALAWAMLGRSEEARADLLLVTRLGKEVHPLSSLEWFDFDSLVTDETIKADLRQFFNLDSPQPSPPGEP